MRFFFVSDLHGRRERYETLFAAIRSESPNALFIGGDFMPSGLVVDADFIESTFRAGLDRLKSEMDSSYPRVFLIFGNDDLRSSMPSIQELETAGLVELIHERSVMLGSWQILGYSYVPPTPFLLKDWERFDVGRHVEPGCVSPEEGSRSVQVDAVTVKFATIAADLEKLSRNADATRSIWLFHAPPYRTNLDRAALDGKSIDHVPLDVNVGSIAIRRFIESNQPRLTMHGHIHESARLSGSWRDRIGETEIFGAAHDGPELALVRFDPENPAGATRELLG